MSKQMFAGMGLGAVLLFILIGAGVYVSSNNQNTGEDTGPDTTQALVEDFTEHMRAETVARVGQPIEGFEPFMFMQAFPGLIASDFADVDALIGLYRYQNGEVVYDLNGEIEAHSAARAISDEGMAQLLSNISARITFMAGEDMLEQIFLAISPEYEPHGTTTPEVGEEMTVKGEITCLPHKGDGPHTMECAFGLKADSGVHYGLSNLWTVAPELTDTGAQVEITGTFIAAPANEKYDIAGYIDVHTAERL